jgi:hypothetical protein
MIFRLMGRFPFLHLQNLVSASTAYTGAAAKPTMAATQVALKMFCQVSGFKLKA